VGYLLRDLTEVWLDSIFRLLDDPTSMTKHVYFLIRRKEDYFIFTIQNAA
jgi:hypothetical protein